MGRPRCVDPPAILCGSAGHPVWICRPSCVDLPAVLCGSTGRPAWVCHPVWIRRPSCVDPPACPRDSSNSFLCPLSLSGLSQLRAVLFKN